MDIELSKNGVKSAVVMISDVQNGFKVAYWIS